MDLYFKGLFIFYKSDRKGNEVYVYIFCYIGVIIMKIYDDLDFAMEFYEK